MDRNLLYLNVFLRSVATSMLAIVLPLYFAEIDFDAARIGVIVSAGLGGAAVASAIVTFWGDRIGRRRTLVLMSILTGAGCLLLALTKDPIVMSWIAFFAMFNGMGRDRGAALILEQAALPSVVPANDRTRAFALYNIAQDVGSAIGALLAATPGLLRGGGAFSPALGVYAALLLLTAACYSRLSAAVELNAPHEKFKISPSSRGILWKISALFSIDSIAGGFLTASLLSYFFHERFGVNAAEIGGLFFFARVLNAMSHYGAAWLAKRIGLVNTMVFTHIPSSLLLMTVPFAPNFWVASLLFLLREGMVEMDVPTRQSYVMAVVKKEERTFASGVTHLVRMAGWAIAPVFAGTLMSDVGLSLPLLICGGMKITYDVLLYLAFRKVRPPE